MNIEEPYRATVTDTDDPDRTGRIKVTSSQAVGAGDASLPMWVEPATQWGWFYVPDVGEEVEIVMASHGDMDESFGQASLEEPDVRWKGIRIWTTDDAETPRPVPKVFTKENYGKRRGFATPTGHFLMFDDTEGKERISLSWSGKAGGATKNSTFDLDDEGSILIGNINGSAILLDAPNKKITVVDENGNSITMESGKITVVADTVDIKAANKVILMDGADDKAVRALDWSTKHNAHTHPSPMGPTGTPTVPTLPTDSWISTNVEIK